MLLEGMNSENLLLSGLGFEQQIVDIAQEEIQRRRYSGSSDHEYEVNIGTKLLEVNGIQLPNAVKGFVTVKIHQNVPVSIIVTRSSIETVQESITVTATRIVK